MNPIEVQLAEIWCEVLGLDRVGIHDPYLELGGHSLLAGQIQARIHRFLGVTLPVNALFLFPTVASLAAALSDSETTEPGPVRSDALRFPLSGAQERLWFMNTLLPESPLYNISFGISFSEPAHDGLMEQALNRLLARHESLRTAFLLKDGQSCQEIYDEVDLELCVNHVSRRQVDGIVKEMGCHLFDLTRPPLMRASLLHLNHHQSLLVICVHHIVFDGWSLSLFLRDLFHFYQQCETSLPEIPLRYVDYALWQKERLASERVRVGLDWWAENLRDLPNLELPADRPRPAVPTCRGARWSFHMDQRLSRAVEKWAVRRGTTPFVVLLAAFKTLLLRYSGQTDFAVGTTIANRAVHELEDVIGFFVNLLVLRSDLRVGSFTELVDGLHHRFLEAQTHAEIPFERIVDRVNPQRGSSHSPLFQVLFILQNMPDQDQPDPVIYHNGTARFDLTMELVPCESGYEGLIEYNTDLFDEGTVTYLASHYHNLLDGALTDPNRPLTRLPLLSREETHHLVVDWNRTIAPYPERCIHQLFENRAAAWPRDEALRCGDQVLSCDELNQRANRLAHHLRDRGLVPGEPVCVCLERSPDLVAALLAVMKAGGCYVPLDPEHPQDRLAFIARDCGARFSLVTRETLEKVPITDAIAVDDPGIENVSGANLDCAITHAHAIYILYTSGSTGKPKGVMLTHGALGNFLHAMIQEPGIHRNDTLLAVTTISFDIAFLELFAPLISGARLVLADRSERRDGLLLAQALKKTTCYRYAGHPGDMADVIGDGLVR